MILPLHPNYLLGRFAKYHDSLLEEWIAVSKEFNLKRSRNIFTDLWEKYSDNQRHYHAPPHLATMLGELKDTNLKIDDPGLLKLAIFFHDAIYDPHRNDNEEKSAKLAFVTLVDAGFSYKTATRIYEIIKATDYRNKANTIEEKTIKDLDLVSLGKSKKQFDKVGDLIRKEYTHVPEDQFIKNRGIVLGTIYNNGNIFYTQHFRNKYQNQAKKNLEDALGIK